MSKRAICNRAGVAKSPELIEAERDGKARLREYMRNRAGRQAELARISGLLPGTLSNMANHPTHGINLEAAMILEVATSGELPAEALCPSGAKLLERFFLTRAAKVAG